MIITAVQIERMENTGTKLKGIASITLDNMIVIHDIRILEGNSARFLAMPSKAVRAGVFKDIVHPISSEVRIAFERIIFFVFDIAEERKLFSIKRANEIWAIRQFTYARPKRVCCDRYCRRK